MELPTALAQEEGAVNNTVQDPNYWTATLHFDDVDGFENPVDLFHYVDSSKYKAIRKRGYKKFNPAIKFDRTKYAPTKEGLKKLMLDLKNQALLEGSLLVQRNDANTLNCFRCRAYRRKAISENDNRRGDGLPKKKRNRSTKLPLTPEAICHVSLRVDIYTPGDGDDDDDGYLFLRQGAGSNIHSFHPKPSEGELALRSRQLDKAAKDLIESGGQYPLEFKDSLENIGDDSDSFDEGDRTFTQESVREISAASPSQQNFQQPPSSTIITEAQLITYFKGIMPLFDSQASRTKLMHCLTDAVKEQTKPRKSTQNTCRRVRPRQSGK